MSDASPVQLIAIVGGSGAGKGWLVERLCGLLPGQACHLQLDDFYLDRSHLPPARRARLNFDRPRAIDWTRAEQVLRDCRAGRATSVPAYDFATHSARRVREEWTPRPLVFVDGLWLLRRPAVRRMFDLALFLDVPADLRCSRRRQRDVAERGYNRDEVERALHEAVLPMHDRYVEPQRRWADLILTQPYGPAELDALAERLWALLTRAGLRSTWDHATFRADLHERLSAHEYCN